MEARFTASDTLVALTLMVQAGGRSVCPGGDGTQHLTVGVLGDIPLAAVSAGTNNVFPYWAEPTMAGLAAGYVATGWSRSRSAASANTRLPPSSRRGPIGRLRDPAPGAPVRHVRTDSRAGDGVGNRSRPAGSRLGAGGPTAHGPPGG